QYFFIFICITTASISWAEEPSSVSHEMITVVKPELGSEFSSPKYKAHIDALILGKDSRDALSRSSAAMVDIDPRLDIIYNSWLSFDFEFEAFFLAGNSKNFYTEEGKSS